MELLHKTVDIFISRKSEDRILAQQLYQYLSARGLVVFESDETLPKLGNSDYRKAIDKALDECSHMIVIGSSAQNISSLWVEAEWGFYINEKRAGRKKGNILTVTAGKLIVADLPASLRYYEVIPFKQENFERIEAYLNNNNISPNSGTREIHKSEKTERVFTKPSFSEATNRFFKYRYSIDGCDYNIPSEEGLLFVEQIDADSINGAKYFITHQKGSNLIKVCSVKDGELVALLKTELPLKKCRFYLGVLFAVHGSREVINWTPVPSTTSRYGVDWEQKLFVEIPEKLENFRNPAIDDYAPFFGRDYRITLLIREEDKNVSAGMIVNAKRNDKDNHYRLNGHYYDHVRGIKRLSEYAHKYREAFLVLTKSPTEKEHIWRNHVIIKDITDEDIVLDANDVVDLHHDSRLLITLDKDNAKAIQYIDPLVSRESTPIEYAHTFSTSFNNRGEIICYPHEDLVAAKPSTGGYMNDIVIWARHHNKGKGGNFRKVLTGHRGKIDTIRWSEQHYHATDPYNSWWANFSHGWGGRSLISSSEDGTIRIWEPETGNELACFNNCHVYSHPFCWTITKDSSLHIFLFADRDGFVHAFELIQKSNK